MLLLKLVLVPLLLLLASLAGRRWGPAVAGRVAGLPLVAGPILLFLTIDRGPAFGAVAATMSLAATAAVLAFNLAYARACHRTPWPVAWLTAAGSWGLAVTGLASWSPGWWGAAALGGFALAAAPSLFPRRATLPAAAQAGRLELVWRMGFGALLTVCITEASAGLGPVLSGLVTTFPVMTTVLAISTHRLQGPAHAVAVLRGMVTGLTAFAAFCGALALALSHWSMTVAFLVAVAAAMCTQGLVQAVRQVRPVVVRPG